MHKINNVFTNFHIRQTPEFDKVQKLFESTQNNYFLTGNAGTGKSTLITNFRKQTKKKVALLSPTGLSAINIGGQTIHSFFRFPPQFITADVLSRIRANTKIIKNLNTIIIDEASMVRADLLDGINYFLKKHGPQKHLPFGGIQIILSGDLFQLPPVVTNPEKEIMNLSYQTPYFFSSDSYNQGEFETLKLTHIFRQNDEDFVNILNRIRTGNVEEEDINRINSRVGEGGDQAITLTAVNHIADIINTRELKKLPGTEYSFTAQTEGSFNATENNLPAPAILFLRPQARVMFVKNSADWVNGTLGIVESVNRNEIKVRIDDTNKVVTVPTESWNNIRYSIDSKTGKVEEDIVGSYYQYPLRLAWAITIHKSQGMTFSHLNLDLARAPFAHGQAYVALSRCRTLSGLTLTKPLKFEDIITDELITNFLS